MTNPQITLSQGKFIISGGLTFASAKALLQASAQLFPQQEEWHCDFSQVTSCDSAGLSLLFEWIKFAKQQHKNLRFSQIPQQLHSIASAAGLDKILREYQ